MSNLTKKIYFLPDGMTAVFDGEEQVPELQRPWVELFAEFLESKGENASHFELHFPDGLVGRIFMTDEGDGDWRFLIDYESPLVDKRLEGAEERALRARIAPERRRSSREDYQAPADARGEIMHIAGSIMWIATRPWDAALNKDERKMLLRAGELLLTHPARPNPLEVES
jgi:hypothetical protein